MKTPKTLYIDPNGVLRGYYVYAHRNLDTNMVFYVGKGHGRRAWDSVRRHEDWENYTESLSGGWDVQILQDDLSETEAFQLEEELVEKYGGASSRGGVLKNYLPGGEHPGSVTISFRLTDQKWSEYYNTARTFKDLQRPAAEAIATSVIDALEPFMKPLSELEDQAEERDDDDLFDSACEVGGVISDMLEASAEFRQRRCSWKDLGLSIESSFEDLESELLDTDRHPEPIKKILRQTVSILQPIFNSIDSGNQKYAVGFANSKTKEA